MVAWGYPYGVTLIVETWPGPGTGDLFCRDQYGNVWQTSRGQQLGTGDRRAHKHGNVLVEIRDYDSAHEPIKPKPRKLSGHRALPDFARKRHW